MDDRTPLKHATLVTFLRRLFHLRRGGTHFESPRYLLKWLFLSALIGIVAGLGAIAFFWAIGFVTDILLGRIVGYLPPNPAGEGGSVVMPFWSAARPWLLPVITTAGGLVAGIIVFTFAPEAEGHGTDAAIKAFHEGKPIRARIPLIKLVASAITIGSGGSGGREGPSAQISAGFGSLLATALHLNVQDRRIAIAVGIGSGIGAIFRAPLGGAILAAEILYKDDLEIEAIIPALMASIIGYSVFGLWSGWVPIFGLQDNLAFTSPPQLLFYVVLGLLSGLVGLAYARGFYGLTDIFHHIPLPHWVRPGIGGLLVGLIGLLIPQALGMGYGWVQQEMSVGGVFAIPLWVILILPFVKILATGLSIGSGGSGGIFGPGMVIGGSVGAALWRLCYHVVPGVPPTPAPFVIIGMMATFGGIAHAPLAVMLMVAEMTGNLSLLAPAMIAVGISTALVGNETIYRSQLPDRSRSPVHRHRFGFPLLATLSVRDAMEPPVPTIPSTTLVGAAKRLLADEADGAIVLDPEGRFVGVLRPADLAAVPEQQGATLAVSALLREPAPPVLDADTPLDHALEQLAQADVSWAPVLQAERVVGRLHLRDITAAYRQARPRD